MSLRIVFQGYRRSYYCVCVPRFSATTVTTTCANLASQSSGFHNTQNRETQERIELVRLAIRYTSFPFCLLKLFKTLQRPLSVAGKRTQNLRDYSVSPPSQEPFSGSTNCFPRQTILECMINDRL